MTRTPEQIQKISNEIRDMVLDQMVALLNKALSLETTRTRLWDAINSGDFDVLKDHYNEQVNAICDELKNK